MTEGKGYWYLNVNSHGYQASREAVDQMLDDHDLLGKSIISFVATPRRLIAIGYGEGGRDDKRHTYRRRWRR